MNSTVLICQLLPLVNKGKLLCYHYNRCKKQEDKNKLFNLAKNVANEMVLIIQAHKLQEFTQSLPSFIHGGIIDGTEKRIPYMGLILENNEKVIDYFPKNTTEDLIERLRYNTKEDEHRNTGNTKT